MQYVHVWYFSSNLVKGKSVGANKKDKSVFENAKLIKTDEFDDFFNLIIIDKNLLATIGSKKSLIKESDFEITSFDQEMILKYRYISSKKTFQSKFQQNAFEKLKNSFDRETTKFLFKCDNCKEAITDINKKCIGIGFLMLFNINLL